MTLSRAISDPPAGRLEGQVAGASADRAAPAAAKARARRPALGYFAKVLIATGIEAAGLYGWLWLHEHEHPWWGLAALVLGETVETMLFRAGTARDGRIRWGPLDATKVFDRHFRTMQRRVGAMGIAEIAIWLLWLEIAREVGQVEAAVALLVLMHLKHHVEVVTVRDMPMSSGLFAVIATLASALEVAGAVGALVLLDHDQFVLAAVAVTAGILLEHAIQIDVLNWEMKARDIRIPRDPRWKPPPRRRPLLVYFFTRFAWFWRLVERSNRLARQFNRQAINGLVTVVEPRPNPLSTMAPYTSWPSLTDRTYSGRHLPPVGLTATRPATCPAGPPSAEAAAALFERREMIECPKSTVLFAFFAQWFTDGFLRSARDNLGTTLRDTQRNQSTHDIDLSQLYGLNRAMTRQLRASPEKRDRVTGRPTRGLLRHQIINNEEYPQFYAAGGKPRKRFDRLLTPVGFQGIFPEEKSRLFAIGTDITNVGALACNVLFLREHNRIARRLGREHPTWDDDRVFETTRNILTVVLLKVAIEDYVNHITPNRLRFRVDPTGIADEPWYRQNWMAIEFNLLYRWHSLVPSTFAVNGRDHTLGDTLWDTRLLTDAGLGAFMAAATSQPAGRVGVHNTDRFLVERADLPSIKQARVARLGSYNDYRRLCGLLPATGFDEISSDEAIQTELSKLYRAPEDVEFYVGLFAEDRVPNSVLPELMATMVAFDAFSQALTNPLLAPRIHNEATFSRVGLEIIDETTSFADLVQRNIPRSADQCFVSFTRQDYRA